MNNKRGYYDRWEFNQRDWYESYQSYRAATQPKATKEPKKPVQPKEDRRLLLTIA